MQVLKSSSTVSGAYSLAGASTTNLSVVVGTHIYNQHQYQHQQKRSPSPKMQLRVRVKVGTDEAGKLAMLRLQRLPVQRNAHRLYQSGRIQQQQPSSPLSASSQEQVTLLLLVLTLLLVLHL